MADYREFAGRSLEECLNQVMETLGIPDEQIHYKLVDPGRKGIFGLGARDVRIRVELPPKSEARTARPPKARPANRRQARSRGAERQKVARGEAQETQPAGAKKPRKAGAKEVSKRGPRAEPRSAQRSGKKGKPKPTQRKRTRSSSRRERPPRRQEARASEAHLGGIQETVARMFRLMGMEIVAEASMNRGGIVVELDGPDRPALLDNDAELLFAVQFLLNRMSRRAWPGSSRIQLSCSGFSSRRDDELVKEIREVADQVARTGESKRLQPMNPYERRLVHLTIRDYPDLSSCSEGDGFMKAITVSREDGNG